MRRTLAIAAALFLALLAFTPQVGDPVKAQAAPSEIMIVEDDFPSRHTPVSRAVRTVAHPSLVVAAGDTYGKLATAHCGTFSAWRAMQAANGWPERRIPVGAKITVSCKLAAAIPARQPIPPAAAPKTTGAPWVHPLASGRHAVYPNCFRTSQRPGHNGVDLTAPNGTAIRAVAAGTVHRKAFDEDGAGYYVTLKHPNGIYTQYHHLIRHSPLGVGASVVAGQTIGNVGLTGNSRGYHVHFETMRGGYGNGYHINPAPFMRQRGVNLGC